MQITIKLYAMLTQYLPNDAVKNQATLAVAEGTTIAEIINQLHMPAELVHLVLLNGVYVQPEQIATTQFNDSDVLAIWPPVAGG